MQHDESRIVTVTHEGRNYSGRYWTRGPNLFVVCTLVMQGATLGHASPSIVARRVLLEMVRSGLLDD